jgi:hypothetical protein
MQPQEATSSDFLLRTWDGERPVQRLKAWLKELDCS